MNIGKLFNIFAPSEQIKILYRFIWVQIILQGIVYTEKLPNKYTHKASIVTIFFGIYIIFITNQHRIINMLEKQEHSTERNTLKSKFVSLICTIIFATLIAYI
jgi:hypothetical protein